MEIERKYLIDTPPEDYRSWPFHQIEQAYLCTAPTVRVRREDDTYYMTYKGGGLLAREEYNLPLTKEAYDHLLAKADGRILTKKRYLLPLRNAYSMARDASPSAMADAVDAGIVTDAADPGIVTDAVNPGIITDAADAGIVADAADPGIVTDAVDFASQIDNANSASGSSERGSAIPDRLSANAADLTIEMDVFEGAYEGLILAEVEFPTEEAALAFTPPEWFGRDVTFTGEYSNSRLATASPDEP